MSRARSRSWLLGGSPDQPGDAARRVREREAAEQAHRETLEKFGAFTPENASEAIAWQESRIRELIAGVQ